MRDKREGRYGWRVNEGQDQHRRHVEGCAERGGRSDTETGGAIRRMTDRDKGRSHRERRRR